MLPNSGRELLLDLKRSAARNAPSSSGINSNNDIPTLPTYNNKLVQACFQDLHGTVQELDLKAQACSGNGSGNGNDGGGNNTSNNKPGMSVRPSILLHDKTIHRHKQCLLAYHHYRMEIIKDIQRRKAAANDMNMSNSNNSNGNANANNNNNNNGPISTNAQEVAFAREYAALRETYSNTVFELDLLPPTSQMVQVRVLKDIGQVVLPDSGRAIAMTKGACLFLDRADVKDFLRQGIVQLYDGEEVDF